MQIERPIPKQKMRPFGMPDNLYHVSHRNNLNYFHVMIFTSSKHYLSESLFKANFYFLLSID